MKGKILFATGLAVGYVLGTRAGRERYEEIKAFASKFWNDPRVQKQVHSAEDAVSDGAKRVASSVADKVLPARKTTTTTPKPRTSRASTTKPSSAK